MEPYNILSSQNNHEEKEQSWKLYAIWLKLLQSSSNQIGIKTDKYATETEHGDQK